MKRLKVGWANDIDEYDTRYVLFMIIGSSLLGRSTLIMRSIWKNLTGEIASYSHKTDLILIIYPDKKASKCQMYHAFKSGTFEYVIE